MKKTILSSTETMRILTMLTGFLIGLGIGSYLLVDYPMAFADTIQNCLPSGNRLVRWLTTI